MSEVRLSLADQQAAKNLADPNYVRPGGDSAAVLMSKVRRTLGGVRGPGAPAAFRHIGGPVTQSLVSTGLGAGLGYLAGRYIYPWVNPDIDKRRAGRLGALMGGGVAALAHVPLLADQKAQFGWRGMNSTPYSRVKSNSIFPQEKNLGGFASQLAASSGTYMPATPLLQPYAFNQPNRPYRPDYPDHGFSATNARREFGSDPFMSPMQRRTLIQAVPPRSGMVTVADVSRGLIGAGLGYVGGGVLGSTIGRLFNISRTTRKKLRAGGAIAGAVHNTGLLSRAF